MKNIGTMSIGVRAPIIKKGDNLVDIVTKSVVKAGEELNLPFNSNDVVAVTEAVVARTQGNYATKEQIATDVKNKTGGKTVGVLFPIMSRNRFSMLLQGISLGVEKVILQLSYPCDEVGNPLLDQDILDKNKVNPYSDNFSEEEFVAKFGKPLHPFTKVNYLDYYKSVCKNCEIILSNNPLYILNFTDTVIVSNVHARQRTKRILLENGAKKVLNLDEILTSSVDGSGYNEEYGILGSNLATEDSVKLFPRDCEKFVDELEKSLYQATNVHLQVMIYGDGAFKDPVGGIWELADPVVSPAHTKGLVGSPNELKLKYLADTTLKDLSSEDAEKQMKKMIKEKGDLAGSILGQGTTPRRLTDLLGSLSDLTSGSGDKGTPIILIKGYFDNFANDQ